MIIRQINFVNLKTYLKTFFILYEYHLVKGDINMTKHRIAGSGSWLFKGQPNEVVIQEGKTLTSISKANALNYSMVFWDQISAEAGKGNPLATV